MASRFYPRIGAPPMGSSRLRISPTKRVRGTSPLSFLCGKAETSMVVFDNIADVKGPARRKGSCSQASRQLGAAMIVHRKRMPGVPTFRRARHGRYDDPILAIFAQ